MAAVSPAGEFVWGTGVVFAEEGRGLCPWTRLYRTDEQGKNGVRANIGVLTFVRLHARCLAWAMLAGSVVFLLAPLVVTILVSLSRSPLFALPTDGLS